MADGSAAQDVRTIDVDGVAMQTRIGGTGRPGPTLVLEAAFAEGLNTWNAIFEQLALAGARRRSWAVRYAGRVSPTVLRIRGYRFYFFSREEPRPHVHVQHAEGEAKFWLEPRVEIEGNYGLKPRRLAEALKLVEEHADEFRRAWSEHFPG